MMLLTGVADPDPHHFGKPNPDPHQSEKLVPDPHQSQNAAAVEALKDALKGRRRSQ
jgi:hypothetical protein